MAGRRSPTVPALSTSARLRPRSATREQGGWFHSLPNIRLAPRERTESAYDKQRTTAADATAGTRPKVSTTRWTKATQSRDVQLPQQLERGRTRLSVQVHSQHSGVEEGARACGAGSTNSQLAALTPLSKSRPVVANIPGKKASDRRWKCKSKSVKVANLKTSLRLVPQQLVFTPIGAAAAAGVKGRNSLGRSLGQGSSAGLSEASRTSSRYRESDKDSPQVHTTTQWIDKGPVVSPMYAIVLQSPLRLWKNASFGDAQADDSTGENETSSSAAKSSTLDDNSESGSNSKAMGRGSCLPTRHVRSLPLLLMLTFIAILLGLALYAARDDNAATNAKFGGVFTQEGEYITVPPGDDTTTEVRGQRRHPARSAQQDWPVYVHDREGLLKRAERAFKNIIEEADDHDNATVNEGHHTTF